MNILIFNKGSFICPECNNDKIRHDFKRCESYCLKCGLVCIDNTLTNSAGVRLYDLEVMDLRKKYKDWIAGASSDEA